LEKNLDKSKPEIQKPKSKIQNRNVSQARIAVFEILQKIEKEKAFSSNLLPLYEETLAPKDRALCHELTLGVLRRQIRLDKIIEKLISKKLENFDSAVRTALRLGLYQILYTDKIPHFAAINESVNLVHRAKKRSAAGLVNAVLRRSTREPIELDFGDETERISVERSHPRWLTEKWIAQFGIEAAENLIAANNETPGLVFRLTEKSDEKTVETLEKFGLEIIESPIVSGAYRVSTSNEMLRLFADDGKIYFQDEASQMVANAVNLGARESFLDVCASPGSKTTLIANSRFQISNLFAAGDFYEHRVKILQENCRRQAVDSVQIIRYDAEKPLPFANESFDVALVDAPCSGTGTIRHNPEIRYFLRKEDFGELSEKQLKILTSASKIIKRGGRLIYSTCSLETEENEFVAERFLAENDKFQKISPDLGERFLTETGFARTLPHRDGIDGFFIAVFQRR
jgi:16S rRNA (cytosine967-C5)-methyltransferase